MIRLFNQDEVNFQHNKYVLSEATKCDITEYLNDTFELDLEYPINDKKGLSQLLTTNAIIKAPVGDSREDQLFVIRKPKQTTSKTERKAIIYGQHIAIDKLGNNIVPSLSIVANRKDAIASILNNTLYAHNFSVGNKDTNTTVGAAFKVTRVNPITAIMGIDEADENNSTIANEFGGDIIFDNFTIDVVDQRGEDNNVIIAYAKNITGVEMQVDDMDLITDLIPIGKDVEGNPLLLPEYHIQSDNFNNYPHAYVDTVDVDVQVVNPEIDDEGVTTNADDVMTIEQCYTKMREAVDYMYTSQKVDQLNFTLTVNFIQLENTLEYENYSSLQRVKQVGDYVIINHEPLGLALKGRVNKIVWDCLNLNKTTKKPKIKEIEIGFTKKTLSDIISETNKSIRFTQQSISMQVSNLQGTLYSKLEITESSIRSEVADVENSLSSTITQTASDIRLEVTNADAGLQSQINVQDDKIALKVNEEDFGTLIEQNSTSVTLAIHGKTDNKVTVDSSGLTVTDGGFTYKNTYGDTIIEATPDGIRIGDSAWSNTETKNQIYLGNSRLEDMLVLSEIRLDSDLDMSFETTSKILGLGRLESSYAEIFNDLWVDDTIYCESLEVNGGTKNCSVDTVNYGRRLLNAYETASVYFGDIQEDTIKEDGKCVALIDEIFKECVNTTEKYHVFYSTYSGSISKVERYPDRIEFFGEVGTTFSYEIKAKRIGFENTRLELSKNQK